MASCCCRSEYQAMGYGLDHHPKRWCASIVLWFHVLSLLRALPPPPKPKKRKKKARLSKEFGNLLQESSLNAVLSELISTLHSPLNPPPPPLR